MNKEIKSFNQNYGFNGDDELKVKLTITYEDEWMKIAYDEDGNTWIGDVFNTVIQWKMKENN